jgi:hypothetical protein
MTACTVCRAEELFLVLLVLAELEGQTPCKTG